MCLSVCVCVCVCVCVYPSGRIHVAACGPIGTKFGTHMEIHLEMVSIYLYLLRGQKITNLE